MNRDFDTFYFGFMVGLLTAMLIIIVTVSIVGGFE